MHSGSPAVKAQTKPTSSQQFCHSGLKALVMNNYSRREDYGGWGGGNCRKQVCAMNYTSGEMAPYVRFMHFRFSCACLCLQSQTA